MDLGIYDFGKYGFRDSKGFHGNSRYFKGFQGILRDFFGGFKGYERIIRDFRGFQWSLRDFTG